MGVIIAIDIGGTHLRVAVYPRSGTTPLDVQRTATRGLEPGVFERLTALIDSVWPKEPVEAISVAVPGPINPYAAYIIETPNILGLSNFPIGEKLAGRYHVPVYAGNDANLAALGEWHFGAGQGHHNLIYMTISTGIGGGVIVNDQLLLGSRGLAAELGHVTVLPEGPVCSCGQRGHLEGIASGTGITRYVNERLAEGNASSLRTKSNFGARDIAEAAGGGDELATSAFAYAGGFIGLALANYLQIFNPSMVILGGGVSQSGALILDPIKASLQDHVMNPSYLEGLELTIARLGDDVGLLGALAQAQLELADST
jgi:glucokinase